MFHIQQLSLCPDLDTSNLAAGTTVHTCGMLEGCAGGTREVHLVHMGGPALERGCAFIALEGVRSQGGGIAPQAGLLQRCHALLRQP